MGLPGKSVGPIFREGLPVVSLGSQQQQDTYCWLKTVPPRLDGQGPRVPRTHGLLAYQTPSLQPDDPPNTALRGEKL